MQKKKVIGLVVGGVVLIGLVVLMVGIFKFGFLAREQKQNVEQNTIGKNESKISKENIDKNVKKKEQIWKVVQDDDLDKIMIVSNKLPKQRWVEDVREYQHGIDLLQKKDGNFVAIWASSGRPLKPYGAGEDGEWIHDVYYSLIDKQQPVVKPIKLIKAPLAQEPASSAINNSDEIMVTMEDAWKTNNELHQTYALYDQNLKAIKPYQQVVFEGGHSGHVASVGNNFAVFYSNEWIDGGGVDNLGSGDDVLLNIYNQQGKLLHRKNIAVGPRTRDWWPLVAGSGDKAVLLWQRFVNRTKYANLILSVYDLKTDSFLQKQIQIKDKVKYYTYDVQYLKDLNQFLVVGENSIDKKGFAILLDDEGNIISEKEIPVAPVRESQPAIKFLNKQEAKVVYPASPDKLLALSIKNDKINIEKIFSVNYKWQTGGTDGIFLENNDLYFLSLSPVGLKELRLKLYKKEK